jgi:hypothetical protein
LGFSGESTPFGIGEVNPSPTHALPENTNLFLQIFDHVQLLTVDPTGEHSEQ